MRWEWLIVIPALALIAFVIMYLKEPVQAAKSIEAVIINEKRIRVEVADTMLKQAKGLSGREYLSRDEGMLFVYRKPGFYSFWMRDMKFPLDIIWIDKDFSIVDITANIQPDSFPQTFTSRVPSQYVLEVNTGKADDLGRIGDRVIFDYAD